MVRQSEFSKKILKYYREEGRNFPWRDPETDLFTLLLTEILYSKLTQPRLRAFI